MDAFLASCAGCVNNPVVPLSCEWLGGVIDAPQTPGLQTMPGVSLWTASVEQSFDAWPSGEHDYVSSKVATASSKCLPGLALAPAQAARVADEAERLSPRIIPPDVFNVRALRCAATLDEALALYVKACEAAPLTLKDYVIEEAKAASDPKDEAAGAWGRIELRPWIRALHGVANTLRKMGRAEEAAKAYLKLHVFDPCDVAGAKRYMALQENAECLTRTSSILNRLGAAALAEFVDTYAARDGEAAWPGAVFTADGWLDDADAFERAATAGRGVAACLLVTEYAPAVDLLTGDTPMPTGRLPAQLTGATQSAIPRSLAAGAGWADGVRALWGKHAGALVWLRKTRRTLQLYRTLSHASGQRTFEDLRSTGVREIARPGVAAGYISRRDVFVSPDFSRARPPGVRPSFEGFVYLAMLAQDVPLVTSLLEAGAPVAGRAEGALTAVHRAAYYGFQAPMFRVLLRLAPDLSPALLLDAAGCAAEQGLGCHLSMLLCRLHGARRVPRGECALSGAEATQLAFRAAASSALDCAAGLGPPCERCASGDGPHAAGASAAAVGAVFGLMSVPPRGRGASASSRALFDAWASSSAEPAGERALQSCAACGAWGGAARLARCGGCRAAVFCEAACQKDGWPAHRAACKKKAG